MYINGEISLDKAIEDIQKKTRHFAKRQMTWFRNKMDLEFIEVDYNDYSKTINRIRDFINSKLR